MIDQKNNTMNKLIIAMAFLFAACNCGVQQESNEENDTVNTHDTAGLPAGQGVKWKADSSTKVHVTAMLQLVNDSIYANPAYASQLAARLKSEFDSLVKGCRMKGADHDALHIWLEELSGRIRELEEEEDHQYIEEYQALKKHVASFNDQFE